MSKLKTILFGTAAFGIPAFQSILDSGKFEIVAAITQPDKPAGRKKELTPPPFKLFAQSKQLKIYQPNSLKEFELPEKDIDLIIVIAYGQIIPKKILDMPKYGCINVHGSLLPKYRGAACVSAAILNGDKESGVTIMLMDEKLDTGPIISQSKLPVTDIDTTTTLSNRLSQLAGETIVQSVLEYIDGKLTPEQQDNSLSSYVPELKKEDGKINWSNKTIDVDRKIRAMQPWPGAYTFTHDKKIIKIPQVKIAHLPIATSTPGKLFEENGKLFVACSDGVLQIESLQIQGKKQMIARDFVNGNRNLLNTVLMN